MIPFNKRNELAKIVDGLKLPLDDVKVGSDASQAELFYKGSRVGWITALPVEIISRITWMYDLNHPENLDWHPIFKDNEEILTRLVRNQLKDQTVALSPASTNRLNVIVGDRKDNLPPLIYGCSFENGTWRVFPL